MSLKALCHGDATPACKNKMNRREYPLYKHYHVIFRYGSLYEAWTWIQHMYSDRKSQHRMEASQHECVCVCINVPIYNTHQKIQYQKRLEHVLLVKENQHKILMI